MSMNSKSVDERVVQMEFDNRQFEAGAKETMSTLDKLKEKLNFENSAKGFDQLNKSVNDLDLSSISNSITAVSDRFSTFGVIGMTVLQRLTNAAMDLGKTLISKAMMPLNQIKTGGWNRALNIENAMFKMSGLLKEEFEENKAIIDENINYAVSGTAYSYDAAASAMAQLVASGVEFRGEAMDMKNALRAISGVAAMTNSDYSEIARVFTAVAGSGRLMAMQLNQLSMRGINAAATLGEQLGKSEAEIREMVSRGQIDFQTFADAMDNAFGEHAKKANDTFTGALSNIKAALSRTGQGFGQSLQHYGRDIFNAIRPNINNFNKKYLQPIVDDFDVVMQTIAKKFADVFGDGNEGKLWLDWIPFVVRSVENILLGLIGIFEAVKNAFDGIFPEKARWEIINFWSKVQSATAKFRDAFIDAKKFADPFLKIIGEAKDQVDAVTNSVDKTVRVAKDLEEIAKRVISGEFGNGEKRFKALEELGYNYKEVQNKVNELLGSSFRYTDVETSLVDTELEANGLLKQKKSLLTSIEKRLDGTIDAEGELNVAEKRSNTESRKRYDILQNITDTAKILASAIRIIKSAGAALMRVVIQPFIQTALPVILENILAITGEIGRKLERFADYVEESELFDKILQGIIDGFIALGGGILWTYEQAKALFDWFINLPIVSSIIERVQQAFADLPTTIDTVRTTVSEFFTTLVNLPGVQTFIASITSLKDAIAAFVESKLQDFLTWFSEFKESQPPDWNPFLDVVNWIAEKIGIIVGGVEALAGLLGPVFGPIIDTITTKAPEVFKDIKDFFGQLPGIISGFFKNDKTTDDASEGFIGGLFENFKSIFEKFPWDSLGGIVEKAIKIFLVYKFAGLLGSVGLMFQGFAGLGNNLKKTCGNVNKAINAMVDNLKADMVLKIAEAVGILALAMFALTVPDKSKLANAAASMFLVTLAISKVVTALGNINKNKYNVQITSVADVLKLALTKLASMAGTAAIVIAVGVSILAFAIVLTKIMKMLGDKKASSQFANAVGILLGGIMLLIGSVAAIMGVLKAFKKFGDMTFGLDLVGVGVAMIGLSAGMLILSVALKNFANMDTSALIAAGISLAVLVAGMAAIAAVSKGGKLLQASIYFIAMALALNLLLIPLHAIAEIRNSDNGEESLKWFAGIMGGFLALAAAFAILGKAVNPSEMLKTTGALLIMAGSLAVIAATLMLFTQFDALSAIGEMAVAFLALSAIMAIVTTAAVLLSPHIDSILKFSLALLAVSAAMAVFSAALYLAGIALPVFVNGFADAGKILLERAPEFGTAVMAVITAIALGIAASKIQMALAGSSIIQGLSMGLTKATPALLTNGATILIMATVFFVDLIEKMAPQVVDGIVRIVNAIADSLMGRKDELAAAFVRLIYAIWAIIIQAVTELLVSFGGLIAEGLSNLPVIGDIFSALGYDADGAKSALRAWGDSVSETVDGYYETIGTTAEKSINEKGERERAAITNDQAKTAAVLEAGGEEQVEINRKNAEKATDATKDNYKTSEVVTEEVAETTAAVQAAEQPMEEAGGALGESGTTGFSNMLDLGGPIMQALQNADGTFDGSGLIAMFSNLGIDATDAVDENMDMSSLSGEKMQELLTGITEAHPEAVGALNSMFSISPEEVDTSGTETVVNENISAYNTAFETAAQDGSGAQTLVDGAVTTLNNADVDFERSGDGNSQAYVNGFANKERVQIAANEVAATAVSGLNDGISQAEESGSNLIGDDNKGYVGGMIKAVSKVKDATGKILTAGAEGLADTNETYKKIGTTAGDDYVGGIESKKDASKTAGNALKSNAVEGAEGSGEESGYKLMEKAGKEAGEGYLNGLDSYVGRIADKAAEMVRKAKDSAQREQDSQSPSKEFAKLGSWAGEGYVIGIKSMGGQVIATAASLANGGLKAMQGVVDKISETMDTNIDYEPTIRPVMDLSNIENGTGLINDAFANMNTYIPVSAIASTGRIASMSTGRFASNDISVSEARVPETVNNFTQNNYSPKALSRLEIYRQTRNMFAMAKGQANA